MVSSSAAEHRKTRRAFVWIAVVAAVLAILLSAAWYVLANRLDVAVREAIETVAGRDVVIDCGNRAVFGYPFRIGLRCEGLSVDASRAGVSADVGALRTAAQIYRPTNVVAELDGPLVIAAEGLPPLDVRWSLAQASAHFWTEGLDRLSLAVDAPVVAVAAGPTLERVAQSDRLEIHARRRADSLDVAFTDRGVRMVAPALAALPDFDVTGDMTIDDSADWMAASWWGMTPGEALVGKAGTIRSLRIAIAPETVTGESATQEGEAGTSGSIDLSGPFSVDADRRISGEFDVALTRADEIAALVSALSPDLGGLASSVASGIAFAGRTENGRTTIRITVREGEASLGVIPLGAIPPLR